MQNRDVRLAPVGGGVSIAYAITGTGEPLVLIHGAEADHTMFDHFVPFMQDGYACIGNDQRDSGQTINPPEPYDVTNMGDDIAGLIRSLGHKKVHVFGTSLGSVIGQALAVRHPDLIDHLILSAAIRIGRGIADINPDAAAELGRLRADPAKNGMASAQYFYTPDHLEKHPELAQIPGAPLLDLSAITAKTLVLAHALDKLVPPAHSLSIAKEIPGAETALLDGLGHVGTIQAPERVASAVRAFLKH